MDASLGPFSSSYICRCDDGAGGHGQPRVGPAFAVMGLRWLRVDVGGGIGDGDRGSCRLLSKQRKKTNK